ncbi:MAG: hypothetical protein U9R56_04535 [candidate division Zixibacteria bacterium]|nr:hypothetical protein [candidate division Zixibacteria bacterium]
MMNKTIALAAGFLLAGTSSVHAANFAVIKSPPTILNFVILVFAISCLVGSFKVTELLRGGFLSKSWFFFAAGFAALALGQLMALLDAFEIVGVPAFLIPALLALMVGFFTCGVLETKRTLG